ncbi:APC family permease [Bombilactobacillus thymidiniphilus]
MKRQLTLTSALATVMGTVIGGGAFFKIATITALTHSTSLTLFVWLLAGIIAITAGLCIAELAAAFPENGGPVKYLQEIYGSKISFLFGWSLIIIYYPANIAALAIVFATQAINLLNLPLANPIPLAILTTLSILLINWLGTRFSGWVQKLTLIVKLLPIFILIIASLVDTHPVQVHLWPLTNGTHTSFISALSQALLATLFAYDGWLSIGNLAGELKNPAKNLTRAIIGGLVAITIIYLLLNLSFLRTLPLNQIIGNQNTAFLTAQKLLGNSGGKILTLGILISVYGAINGHCITGSRMPYAMGANQQLPKAQFFAKLSPITKMPTNSLLFEGIIAIIMIFSGTFDSLTDMLVYISWIFSILLFIGVFKLRKNKPDLLRPYKTFGYPLTPILAILGGLFIIITTTITKPSLAIIGILLTLSGLPIYYWQNK